MANIRRVDFDALLGESTIRAAMAEERADLSTRGLHIKQALVEHGANDSAGAAVLDKGVEFHNYEMADVDVLDAAAQQDALTVDDSIATVKFAENLHRNRPPRM